MPKPTTTFVTVPQKASRGLRGLNLGFGGTAGAVYLLVVSLVAIFAGLLAPEDPIQPVAAGPLTGPSADHWFGTDNFSRDIFSRILFGARVSMSVGVIVTLTVFVLGFAIGMVAAYFGGWVDQIVGRVTDVVMSIPGILLAITIIAVLGPGLVNLLIAMIVIYLPEMIRVVRGAALSARNKLHVRAAVSIGAPAGVIMLRHIAPFVLGPATVQATFIFAYAVLNEAALSFLGLGVQPPTASWGNMVADGLQHMSSNPIQIIIPSLVITSVVLAANLLGDALRDKVDPAGVAK